MITIYKVMTKIINNLNFNYSNLLYRLINYNNNFNKAHNNLKKNWPKNQLICKMRWICFLIKTQKK